MTNDNAVPEGNLAYREYEASLSGGKKVSLAFTLGDMNAESIPARYARDQKARSFGLISLTIEGEPEIDPLMWIEANDEIGLVLSDDTPDLTEDVHRLISRLLMVFFSEIEPIAPQLAESLRSVMDGKSLD